MRHTDQQGDSVCVILGRLERGEGNVRGYSRRHCCRSNSGVQSEQTGLSGNL